MDNGTMVEVFKYLNYCQLANNSIVSKRFCDVIQTHRHKLAFLCVHSIRMYSTTITPTSIGIFDKELSLEAYNEWVIRNKYSKLAPLDNQVANTQNTQHIPNGYWLNAYAHYKDSNHREWNDKTNVLIARVKLNHENWPAFQHFVRLATDPFIYIDSMELTYQNDVLNMLARAIKSDCGRLQCKELNFNLNGNNQKSISWAKDYVNCNQFYIYGESNLNLDEAFLDFFFTGVHCTPSIVVSEYNLSKALVVFLQKFMDFKNSDEGQLVEAIEGKFMRQTVKLLNRDYAEFFVREQRNDNDWCTDQLFEFDNNDIGKKLHLTAKSYDYRRPHFSIKINNL